ncbi:head GIN domain-containing protein [Gaetbulibacter aestuarii]|uniref:Head GIN domain-containing protein n=1 Tax=Gaetbulibacter aestuarii TaxID=1502358 RepID=A0ABW7N100_9FLAO
MKKVIYILVLLMLSCSGEKAGDCFESAGPLTQEEVTVPSFDKILVNRNIELILKDGATQKVVVEAGQNSQHDITATVTDGKLTLTDNNTCNFVRDYTSIKVYITSPNITEIRASTQYDVRSDGVLSYPSFTILSEDYNDPDGFPSANFYLQLDVTTFRVVFNNLSNCYVSGHATNLNVTLAAGTSRFEGRDLSADNVTIWNRSSNDMILNPQQSIKGKISGIGNVICANKPPVVDVQELYRGRLIFE